MTTDKNKIVQNYCLQELRQVYPDQSEIWTARHKILKKIFTLKRIKYRPILSQRQTISTTHSEQSVGEYEKLMFQTNLLKRLNAQYAPKCYKMIKTSNNLYLVFDQFPNITLKEYLSKNLLDNNEKYQLMEDLTRAVFSLHNKEVVNIGLGLQNIYLKDKNQIFFGDWSLARVMGGKQKIALEHISNKYKFIASEAREGFYGYWSDIYSLGQIFGAIQSASFLENTTSITKRLQTLINNMINKKIEERPTIMDVLSFFDSKIQTVSNSFKSSGTNQKNKNSTKSTMALKVKQSSSLGVDAGHKTSNDMDGKLTINSSRTPMSPQPPFSKLSNFVSKQIYQYNSVKLLPTNHSNIQIVQAKSPIPMKKIPMIPSPKANSSVNKNMLRGSNNSERKSEDYKHSYMEVNKKRNLSYLMLDLSQFVVRMDMCPQLAFVLLKYAHLTIKQAFQQWERQQWKTDSGQKFQQILEGQVFKIGKSLAFLKKCLSQQIDKNPSLKKQAQIQNTINEKYFNQKVVQFSKSIVLYCQANLNQRRSTTKLADTLFKTYLILKKVEDGSYQKFWQKSCSDNYVFLSNQKYLKEQKNLGYRYLKSRIAQVLSNR